MKKYKICPNQACRKHNKPTAIECKWCEMPLAGVKITDDETEAARMEAEKEKTDQQDNQSNNEPSPVKPFGKMSRICDNCSTHNLANARKCSNCGEDISDITPTQETDVRGKPQETHIFRLKGLTEDILYEIPEQGAIIGREYNLKDYLANKSYVSRKHVVFRIVEGKLFIKNLNSMNHTYVNNVKIENNIDTEVHPGDEIALGGNITNGKRQDLAAYFILETL